MVKALFDENSGILDVRFAGDVSISELVDYIDATRSNKHYPRVLKILTDATHAEMNFSPADLEKVVAANFKSLEQYKSIIDAIVIDSPRETAISMFYQDLAKTNKYKFEVFSTRGIALSWLEDQ